MFSALFDKHLTRNRCPCDVVQISDVNLNVVPTVACVALVMYMTTLRYCMYVQVQRMQIRPYMYMYVHAATDIVIHVAE